MTKRYGHLLENMPYHRNGSDSGSKHQLGMDYTVSDAQLADDAWRAEFEDHRFDDDLPPGTILASDPRLKPHVVLTGLETPDSR